MTDSDLPFLETEEAILGEMDRLLTAAHRLRFWGRMTTTVGVLAILATLAGLTFFSKGTPEPMDIAGLINGGFCLFSGAWFRRRAESTERLAQSET